MRRRIRPERAGRGVSADADTWRWQDYANCQGAPLNLFFGHEGEDLPERIAREEEAREICDACPVLRSCAEYALDKPDRDGFWGGLNEAERKSARRSRARRANAA